MVTSAEVSFLSWGDAAITLFEARPVRIADGPRPVEFRSIKKLVSRMHLEAGSEAKSISVSDVEVPAWQRQTVWTADEMGLLALSIVENYPIGLVILWEKSNGVRVPIDGRQRLTAIDSFRAGEVAIPDLPGVPAKYKRCKFKLRPGDNPRDFKVLSLEDREAFDDYEPQILEYQNISPTTAMDIFIKLQGGKSLTKTEVRAALGGKLCDFVTQLTSRSLTPLSEQDDEEEDASSHHRFFQQLNIRNSRKAHRNVCDVLLHEYLYPGKNKHWSSLDSMYRDKARTLTNVQMRGFSAELDRFRRACTVRIRGEDVLLPQLRSAFLVLTVYKAWREIESTYAKPAHYSFAKLIQNFETEREKRKRDVPWVQFTAALSNAGYSEGRIQERHEILMSYILRHFPGMALKDRQRRTFTESQKIAIWDRANGRCEFREETGRRCTEVFPNFRDADADHFRRWSDGGPTTLENGRLLCATHNRGRGSRAGTRKKTVAKKTVAKKTVR